jgi:hypothetical protein
MLSVSVGERLRVGSPLPVFVADGDQLLVLQGLRGFADAGNTLAVLERHTATIVS